MPDESALPVDPRRCPLCGGDNTCALAAGASTCWCFETPIPAELIAQVPANLKDLACICPACAAGSTPAATPAATPAVALATVEDPLQDQ